MVKIYSTIQGLKLIALNVPRVSDVAKGDVVSAVARTRAPQGGIYAARGAQALDPLLSAVNLSPNGKKSLSYMLMNIL